MAQNIQIKIIDQSKSKKKNKKNFQKNTAASEGKITSGLPLNPQNVPTAASVAPAAVPMQIPMSRPHNPSLASPLLASPIPQARNFQHPLARPTINQKRSCPKLNLTKNLSSESSTEFIDKEKQHNNSWDSELSDEKDNEKLNESVNKKRKSKNKDVLSPIKRRSAKKRVSKKRVLRTPTGEHNFCNHEFCNVLEPFSMLLAIFTPLFGLFYSLIPTKKKCRICKRKFYV